MTSPNVTGFKGNVHESFSVKDGVAAWELWASRCLSGVVDGDVSHESLVGFVLNGSPPPRPPSPGPGYPQTAPQAGATSLTPSMYGPTAFLPVYGNGQPTAVSTTAFYVPLPPHLYPAHPPPSYHTASAQPPWYSGAPPPHPTASYPMPQPAGTSMSYFHPFTHADNSVRHTNAAASTSTSRGSRTSGSSAHSHANGRSSTRRNA